jgi:tRNA pseudouridine55 synthase
LLPLHPPSLPPSLGVPPSDADIAAGAARLTGDITQVPPMYSAVHHEGRRLYELAREGATVERAGRPVTITSFAVTRDPQDPRCLRFAVECRWVEGGGGGGGVGAWAGGLSWEAAIPGVQAGATAAGSGGRMGRQGHSGCVWCAAALCFGSEPVPV